MAMSFMQMAEEAMAEVDGISAEEAQKRLQQDANALLIDVLQREVRGFCQYPAAIRGGGKQTFICIDKTVHKTPHRRRESRMAQ